MEVLLLNMCDGNEEGYEEAEFDKLNAEYAFLHDTLGWKKGMTNKNEVVDNICTKCIEL